MKIILAANSEIARNFCRDNELHRDEFIIVRNVQTLEGLRFRYEDVIRVPGWSKRADIEDIEDRILQTHIIMSPR